MATAIAGRYEFLDAVRGIAALLVAVQHGSEMLGLPLGRPGTPLDQPGTPLNLGEVGVVAFFLVSGFIIPRSLERHGSLRVFWLGRAFRLYPAYWLSLATALVLVAVGRYVSPFGALPHPWLGVLANAAMVQSLFGLPQGLGVYWTLSLELVFYFLCSLLFVAGLARRSTLCLWAAIAVELLAVLAAAAMHRSLPAGLLGLLVSAFFGTVALRALEDAGARRTLWLAAAPLAFVLALGLYLRFGRYPVAHAVQAPPWLVVVASWITGYALFFTCFALRGRQFPRLLLWLGRISYSLYLCHVLVFLAMPPERSPWLTLVVNLLVTVMVADLSYRLVERPALRPQRRWMPLPRT